MIETKASYTRKSTYKKAFMAAVTVCFATSGTTFTSHYVNESHSATTQHSSVSDTPKKFIQKTTLSYTVPKPKMKTIMINGNIKGASTEMSSNFKKNSLRTTEVELGLYGFEFEELENLPDPMGTIENMEDLIKISPQNTTEVELTRNNKYFHSDIYEL
ncbi:hypothetical protein M3936_16290 [Sutcliffiella horikoshii]|uniref:hypothetical protein n=1 Tax=Sutcliffiella horikoshii TaxID=79883 RepID=UPI0020424D6D|nr:hypothetical protein [Sutcliffiella horikoshii]MCM3619149.1 hypothetical protein [Sutcliffiella horikoshii]